MDVGGKLLAALLQSGDTIQYHTYKLEEKFFVAEEQELFTAIDNHVREYHKLPSVNTILKTFKNLPQPEEPAKYYLDRVYNRFEFRRLNKALTECNDLMKLQDTFTAQTRLLETLTELRAIQSRGSLTDFNSDGAKMILMELHRARMAGLNIGLLTGWPTLDKLMLGLRPGDILSLVGRIQMGKTFFLLWIAMHIFLKQKKRVLVVSMEMNSLIICQRLAAIYTSTPLSNIRSGDMTKDEILKLNKKLKTLKEEEGHLWVVDGNMNAMVDDVFTLAYHLRPDVIAIDGAYLLQHPNPRFDKFRRVEANIEEMKNRCSTLGIPMVLSYQFNREAAKKQKKTKGIEKGGLEDIAFSDAIGQVSTVVLGAFGEETIETQLQREIRILKGRNGEQGTMLVNWLFDKMDFSEILDSTVADPKLLDYI